MQTDPRGARDELNLYSSVLNDPANNVDPNGEVVFGLVAKTIKVLIKGGDIASTVAGALEDGKTIISSNATLGERAGAALSLLSEIASPVSLREGKAAADVIGEKGKDFFRGAKPGEAPSLEPKPGEFKVDSETGHVKSTHGVSVFDNADSVADKGMVPHKIDKSTIPDTLTPVQRGKDPSHYEIVPAPDSNLTPAEYKEALECIKCERR